jgi:hypothetical protein
VRSALHAARLPQHYWTYALKDAVGKYNAMPQVNDKPSPARIFDNSKAPPDYFLPFGQTGWVTITSHKAKLAPRATQMRYLRALNQHQYPVLNPQNKKVCTVRSSELHPVPDHHNAAALAEAEGTTLSDPKTLADARASPQAEHWRKAYTDELRRHDTVLRTWYYDYIKPNDHPVPYIVSFKTKRNEFGGIDKFKARIALRGDRLVPDRDYGPAATAAHMPSQAGRRLLLAWASSEGYSLQTWDVPGAYVRAPSDPNRRPTMHAPPEFDGRPFAPGKVAVMRRAMQCATDANALWESWRDYWLRHGLGAMQV